MESRKVNSTLSGHLLFLIIVSPGRAGLFAGILPQFWPPECRAFSGAFKIEKLKAPLISGPKGAVDTNDLCIIDDQIITDFLHDYKKFSIKSYVVAIY